MIEPFASLWTLAIASDPAEDAQLEAATGNRQVDVVDHIIEDSDVGSDVPHLVVGLGTPAERQAALPKLANTVYRFGELKCRRCCITAKKSAAV